MLSTGLAENIIKVHLKRLIFKMEGGLLPWRIQELNIAKSPDADFYGKPLPPPPIG